jgi:hypothetical protein
MFISFIEASAKVKKMGNKWHSLLIILNEHIAKKLF